jgi:hypothetical protein
MHIAEIPPVCCAVCYQQNPDRIHVDTDAAYDGPLLDVSGARHSVDDIVVCEDCVRAMASMLPESTVKDERIVALERAYKEALEYVALVQTGINQLSDALEKKIELALPPAAPKKPTRRPVRVEV